MPPDTTPDELADVVARTMLAPAIAGMNPAEEKGRRRFRGNEIIPSGDDLVVELMSGVVGMRALQEDGTVVLMGLFGPGDVIAPVGDFGLVGEEDPEPVKDPVELQAEHVVANEDLTAYGAVRRIDPCIAMRDGRHVIHAQLSGRNAASHRCMKANCATSVFAGL